ncbi:MAG TPA: amidohydrolase family protein, partial [Verrucomicrobiae bacterium]
KDYRAIAVPRPATGVIVIEASPWIADNQWVLDLAAREPLIAGYVGYLPIGTKAFAENLKRLAANKHFRGVRLRERKLDDTAFINDLRLLARHNLSLDLAGGMEILPFADRLAGKVPELRIIIDHLAGVAVDGKSPPRQWVDAMRKVARHPGVFCKLSGLVEGTGRDGGLAPRDVEFYRPVLDVMLAIFGSERLMYASDWPVSGRFAPMTVVQGIVGEYFRRFGSAAEEAVFWRTASAAYRVT